jgi:hypothetical protein
MKRLVTFVVFCCAAAVVSVSAAGDQAPGLNRVMREKLAHSQAILAAIVTSDWATLNRESIELAKVTRDPAWVALTAPEYLRQSDAFTRAVQDLIEASGKRDYDAASMAEVALTMSCLQCHRHVARLRVAQQ